MSYNQLIAKAVRLALLQILEKDPNYSHNEYILQTVLEQLGHGLSSDRIRTECRWLEEQGLLILEDVSGVLVARIKQRGVDVALGRSRIDGIARPRP